MNTLQTNMDETHLKEAVRLDPNNENALNNLGNLYLAQGFFPKAIECYEKTLAVAPGSMVALINMGNAYLAMQMAVEALSFYQKALEHDSTNPVILYSMGNCLLSLRQLDSAAEFLQRTIALQPDLPSAHSTLGIVYQQQHRSEEAMACYEKALSLSPSTNVEAYNNLGAIYVEQKRYDEALALFEKALAMKPSHAQTHSNIGLVFLDTNRLDEAAAYFKTAIQYNPHLMEAYRNMGKVLLEQCDARGTIAIYQEALKMQSPNQDGFRINLAKILPPIYSSKADMVFWRNHYEEELDKLLVTGVQIEDPSKEIGSANFYLAYQGFNNCELQKKFASLFHNLPEYREAPISRRHPKPKVGFISNFFHPQHTIGKHFLGLAEHLSRDKFDVTLITAGAHSQSSLQNPHTHIHLDSQYLPKVRKIVAEQELDMLIYTDIGMDPLTYYLAFDRLAPVQCTMWGHPDTTGIPAMDYFLSNTAFETDESRSSYSETLKIFENMITYYPRPVYTGKPLGRNYFSLPEDKHLYYCPQSLFKIHPDFDEILGDILRKDPKGLIVLISGTREEWNTFLMKRFETTIPDVAGRIGFIPRLNREEFLASLQIADVLLDTIHFSAGSTAFEMLSFGLPIVTMPSNFLRGRITNACYQQMGYTECIATTPEEYANLAVNLATQADYREQVQNRIRETSHVLFEDLSAVSALEDFLTQAYEQAVSR